MDKKEKEFCEELTALLHKYKFGIGDEPHIYELNDDESPESDYDREAFIDDEGHLQFC